MVRRRQREREPTPKREEARRPSWLGRRTLIIGGLWVGAALAIAGIYFFLEPDDEARTPTRDAGDARVFRAGVDRAPRASRMDLAVSEDPESSALHRGGPRQTGRSRFRGPANARVAWRYEGAGGISAQAIVAPDGTIFVGDHARTIHAIEPDGSGRWTEETFGPVWSAAALIDGVLLVGSDADVVLAFDAADGDTRWRVHAAGDADSAIVLAPDGTVRFTGGDDLYSATPAGEVQWRFRARGPFVISTPAIDSDGTAYLGSSDDYFYAVAADGRMRWEIHTGDDVASTPAIGDDGTIYFGGDDMNVYAITRDGERRWRRDLGGHIRAPIAIGRDGDVLVGVYGPRPRVVSLDGETGEVRWSFPVGLDEATERGIASGPLVDADGNIYFGAHDSFVYSITREGRLRWVLRVGREIDAAPVLTPEGVLIVGSDDGVVYAIEDGVEVIDGGILAP
jgi:outer membrane protein assembly factor BamB